MENPFVYFDKIFVISAKTNTDRRDYVEEIFSKLDVNFAFFNAVIGNNLSKKEIKNVYSKEKAKNHKTIGRTLSKPEIGCALSHIAIYEQIIEQDLNNALIFEDDISPDFKKMDIIHDVMEELPEDWDLLHLGTLNHKAKAPLSFQLKLMFYFPLITALAPHKLDYKYRQLWNLYPCHYSKSLKKAGYHQGCQAYAMSRSGAKKFFDYHDKIITPMDYMLSVMSVENELKAFISKELLFDQNQEFESSIENSRKKLLQKRKPRIR